MRKRIGRHEEHASCQQNGLNVDMDENNEELSFVPRAVSDSAGWHEPKLRCDRQCRKEGFKFYEIASIVVEDDGERHTLNLCVTCYNLRQEEEMHR